MAFTRLFQHKGSDITEESVCLLTHVYHQNYWRIFDFSLKLCSLKTTVHPKTIGDLFCNLAFKTY